MLCHRLLCTQTWLGWWQLGWGVNYPLGRLHGKSKRGTRDRWCLTGQLSLWGDCLSNLLYEAKWGRKPEYWWEFSESIMPSRGLREQVIKPKTRFHNHNKPSESEWVCGRHAPRQMRQIIPNRFWLKVETEWKRHKRWRGKIEIWMEQEKRGVSLRTMLPK